MKLLKLFFKIIAAGLTAVLILSGILTFYNRKPVHLSNEGGFTDYVWESGGFWIDMSEGTAWGRYDANGYNNLSVVENPDIVIMGSSHMEAVNVLQTQNAATLLSEALAGKYTVYNMGTSGHTMFKVSQYLPDYLASRETPPKAVIIETATIEIKPQDVEQVLTHTVEFTPSYDSGPIVLLQKLPFLRNLLHQIDDGLLRLFMPSNTENTPVETEEVVDQESYDTMFGYLRNLQDQYGTRIILVYHPSESFHKDGTMEFPYFPLHRIAFAETAQRYGISYLDLGDVFEDMFYKEHRTPHGFVNTLPEFGHLNAYGHAAFADAVCRELNRLEEEGILCR